MFFLLTAVLSSSWDGRPFGHNRHGPRIIRTQGKPVSINFESGGCCAPFRWWGSWVTI